MPEEITDNCEVIVSLIGPPTERSFEISVWDEDEDEFMHGITLTTDQARSAFYELLAALVDDGKLPELAAQVVPDVLVKGRRK